MCPARRPPVRAPTDYGRATFDDTDEHLAAIALLLGYAVEILSESPQWLYVLPDEQIIRQYAGEVRCGELHRLPIERLTFSRALTRLERVRKAMTTVNARKQLITP